MLTRYALLLIAGLGMAASPTPEQEALFETLIERAGTLRDERKYDEAEKVATQAVGVAERAFGLDDPHVATAVNHLASLYLWQDKYDAAEPLYQRSLAITEKAVGKDHPDVAALLTSLAALHLIQRKDDPHVAAGMETLANLYHNLGNRTMAAEYRQRARAIIERQPTTRP